MKLNIIKSKKIVAILSSLAITSILSGCTPANPSNINATKKEVVEEIKDEKDQEIEEVIQDTSNEENFTKEYLEDLKQEFTELEKYSKEKWNSEECIEKRQGIKEKLKTLSDFIFNGKEINGITFDELKEEEKENLLRELERLDSSIDEYIPDYKERFKNWIVDKGTDAKEWLVDKGADLKELWTDYKTEVEEEYNSKKLSKKI